MIGYIPLFQLLFPGIGLGALVANFKMGSFFRGIGSAVTTWSKINWKLIYSIVGWPILGTLGGAFFVSQASRAWILPSVILAVVVNEFFTHFKKRFSAENSSLEPCVVSAPRLTARSSITSGSLLAPRCKQVPA